MNYTIKNLLKYNFTEDKEKSNIVYYNSIPYDLNNYEDRLGIDNIIGDLMEQEEAEARRKWEEQQNNIYCEEIYNNTITKTKKEKTHEILPTHKSVMTNITNKEYKTVATLVHVSNYNKEGEQMEAYVYEKDLEEKLNELKEEGAKVPSMKTVKRHIKKLSNITINDNKAFVTIENTKNGIVYKIAQNYEGKFFVTIPIKQARELIVATNDNLLKVFAIFCYKCNEEGFTLITRSYLCEGLGKEPTEKNKDNISTITNVLLKLGYIKVKREHLLEKTDEGKTIVKNVNYYRLATYEEWLYTTKNAGKIDK